MQGFARSPCSVVFEIRNILLIFSSISGEIATNLADTSVCSDFMPFSTGAPSGMKSGFLLHSRNSSSEINKRSSQSDRIAFVQSSLFPSKRYDKLADIDFFIYASLPHCPTGIKFKSCYFLPEHMCPKDFTFDCIINTVLEPAPPLYALKRFVGMKHCPAEAGQFRPVITGFRPSR